MVVIVVAISLTLVLALGLISFDGWWDITVGVLVFSTLFAFISGLVALIKSKDRSLLLMFSLAISVLAILFLLLHSLFISD